MCGFAGTGPARWVGFIILEGGALQNKGNYIKFEGMVLFRRNDCVYVVSVRLYVRVCASTVRIIILTQCMCMIYMRAAHASAGCVSMRCLYLCECVHIRLLLLHGSACSSRFI